MKEAVATLLTGLAEGKKPDIRNISDWLARQQLTTGEWDALVKALCLAYEFRDEEHLAEKIKLPLFTTSTGYVDDFSALVDEINLQGWLREYIEHTRNMEAPTVFHFGTAVTILGATLKRQCWVNQGYYTLWPAVQTMLVGPSGKVKKSTAASYGVELGMQLPGLFNLLPDEGSGEALKTELSQICRRTGESTGLLYVSELGTFLGKQEYNVNLVQALTDLFDSRVSKRRRTVARANEEMKNIAISALLCSNEDWLADAIPATAFGGGFFGRMLVFYQWDTDRCFPRPSPRNTEEHEALKANLLRAKFISGSAVLTADADRWYDVRYRELKKEWPEDERLVPFWERIPDHLLRLGMLLSASDNLDQRDGISVEKRHVQQADSILRWVVRYLPRVYAFLGGTSFGADHQRIYTAIRRRGGMIEEGELGRKMSRRMSRKHLEEYLDTMTRNGVIRRVKLEEWEGKYGWELLRKVE